MRKKAVKKKHSVRHLLLGLMLCGVSFLSVLGVKVCELDAWHEFDPGKILGADETVIIYNNTDEEICCLSKSQFRITVPLSDVPDIVQKAFISAEDARFYEHKGIDIVRIGGAILKDIESGGYVQGASTITQQLIKLSHLSSEKTMQRKAEEAVLAYLMEKSYTKDEILGMYLNYVYFGGGYYGIEAAARGYFGIHASELSAAQGAVLAGILKSPTNYAPHLHYDASMHRHNVVLKLMHDYGYLNDADYSSALSEKIELKTFDNGERNYYVDYTINEACEILSVSKNELFTGGYRIYTAQDSRIQSVCEEIYDDNSFFPTPDVQSAIAVTDSENGLICAMIGGRGEYVPSGYNRAADMRRQPGSCIKPVIVYAPAIEYYGYTAATVISDEPRSFGSYTPKNSGNKYYGNVTVRKAIKSSLNIPAVTVLDDIGIENGKSFARNVGIEFDDSDTTLSLALGGFTYGVSPLQLANAYGALCDGIYSPASSVTRITDRYGKVLYKRRAKSERVLSDANAFILTDILCSVAEDGTGHRLSDLDFDVACKTGTVAIDDKTNRDAWICACTGRHSAAVWIGYDSVNDGKMDSNVTGGTYPAEIVKELFERIYSGEKPHFDMPDKVVSVRLDAKTVEEDAVACASFLTPKEYIFTEYFAEGTEPEDVSTYWNIPNPPVDFACTAFGKDYAWFTFTADDKVIYELVRSDALSETVVDELHGQVGDTIICSDMQKPQADVQYFIRPYKLINEQKLYGAESVHVTIKNTA